MTFLKKPGFRPRACALAFLTLLAALACFSCNTGEAGGTFLKVRVDSTWLAYDSIQVLLDKGDGSGPQRIFGGKVAFASAMDKLPADGYDGGKATIVIRAFKGGKIAREENREYDGAQQRTVSVTVVVAPGHDSDGTVKKDGLSLSLLPRDTLVTIGDSIAFAADAKNDTGLVAQADWDFDGDGKIDLVVKPATAAAHLVAGFRYPAAGVFHPLLTVKGSNGATLAQTATVRVAQDRPVADAGADLNAVINADITLAGLGKDSLGNIAKQEWQVGSAAFQNAPGGQLTYHTPSVAGDVPAIFRVTDDDGQTALDTAIIHVTVLPDTSQDALTLKLDTKDTLISIKDSASYAATARNGTGKLVKAAWDLDGDGVVDSTLDLKASSDSLTAGFRFTRTGTYHPSLTITGAKGGTLKVTLSVRVIPDPPVADAGPDLTAPTDTTLTLTGKAKDGLGRIATQEWSLAGGAFAAAVDGKTTYKTPSSVGDIQAVFRVTDDDGLVALDTALIHVISPAVAALTELTVTGCALAPAFNPDSLGYACPVPFGTASVKVNAKAQGSMTLNGTALANGQASDLVALSAGKATLTLKVTNGSASRTYTVNVSAGTASGNNALKGLVLSAGILAPAFAPDTLVYSASVASSVPSVTVTATLADSNSTLSINSLPAASGVASAAIALGTGPKVILVVVKSQNGQSRTYSVTVAQQSGNANLKTLMLSAGALTPAFAAGTPSYTDSVSESLSSVSLTAVPADTAKASMTLNGSPLAANTAKAIPLTQKETLVTVVVKAEDPGVTKTYVIKVVKYDNVAPTAPTVALGAYVNPDRPTWSWTAGAGGSGNFRYKLDNSNLGTGATATTALTFAPTADLAAGLHTLYVQERDTAGNWSPSGQAAVTLSALKGIADFPLAGHSSDTLRLNGDATMTQAPYLSQGAYISGVYGTADLLTPRLARFDTANFTAEVDFKADAFPDYDQPVMVGGTSARWLGGNLDTDGKISLLYNNNQPSENGGIVKGTQTCVPGVWYTLKLEYKAGVARVYLNGTLSASVTVPLVMRFGDYNFGPSNLGGGLTFKGNWRNLRVTAGTTKIAQYPLSGDARDITGNQEDLTISGVPFQTPGPGATLAGGYNVNDISTPVLSGLDLTDFRITAEFAIAALPTTSMPVFMGGNSSRWIGTRIEANGTLTLICNNNVFKTTTAVVSLTVKHTVAVRFSAASGMASLYLDGVLIGSQTVASLTALTDKLVTTTNYANATAFKGTLYRIRVDGK
jgi:hypothetical protein